MLIFGHWDGAPSPTATTTVLAPITTTVTETPPGQPVGAKVDPANIVYVPSSTSSYAYLYALITNDSLAKAARAVVRFAVWDPYGQRVTVDAEACLGGSDETVLVGATTTARYAGSASSQQPVEATVTYYESEKCHTIGHSYLGTFPVVAQQDSNKNWVGEFILTNPESRASGRVSIGVMCRDAGGQPLGGGTTAQRPLTANEQTTVKVHLDLWLEPAECTAYVSAQR
jgi:hypothetical protein